MRRTEGIDGTLRKFTDGVWRTRESEYKQYRLAIRKVVDRAVEGLGLGEETSTRILQRVIDTEMADPDRYDYHCWAHDLGKMPASLRREATTQKLEEIFIWRNHEELLDAEREIRENVIREKMDERRKAISQSGELHFLFVEGSWDPELLYESAKKTDKIAERLGLNPNNTIISLLTTRGKEHWFPSRDATDSWLSIQIGEIKKCCKRDNRLKIYIHDVRRLPKKEMGSVVQPTGLQELYEDHHIKAYLGETKFGTKSFPWYLGEHALSMHLVAWLHECRNELREHGRLTDVEAQRLMIDLKKRHEEAKRRSLELLRKTVGEKDTDTFLKLGHLVVKSANGRTYRITRDGTVIDAATGQKACVEVDSSEDLPTYDEILAKYLVVRDHPEQIDTLEQDFERDESVPTSLLKQICTRADMSEDEVSRIIERKQEELAHQVTALGAALLVAEEFGVELAREEQGA